MQGIARQATHVHRSFLEGEFRKTNDIWEGRNKIHTECMPGEPCFLSQVNKMQEEANGGKGSAGGDASHHSSIGAVVGAAAVDGPHR